MKNVKCIFALLFTIFCLTSCSNEEALTPSAPEGTNFPQGTNAYDKIFEQYYKDYGTMVLYKYTDADFRWNITSYIPYYSEIADENSVSAAWTFLNDNCLSIWPNSFLKKCLPYRILLASKIWSLKEDWDYDDAGNYVQIYTKVYRTSVYGLNHIAFGLTNNTINNLTTEEKKEAIGEVAYSLIGYATSRSKIDIPTAFKTLHDGYTKYNGEYQGDWGYNAAGCLEYISACDVYQDFGVYVKYLVTMSESEFTEAFLNDNFDCGGTYDSNYNKTLTHPIQQKYQIVIDYFNSLGIDLHAIGARTSALQ